jgi:hypothetical protein
MLPIGRAASIALFPLVLLPSNVAPSEATRDEPTSGITPWSDNTIEIPDYSADPLSMQPVL